MWNVAGKEEDDETRVRGGGDWRNVKRAGKVRKGREGGRRWENR